MVEYIKKAALMRHIEEQAHKWGEDYDAQQILGDIEDFPAESTCPYFVYNEHDRGNDSLCRKAGCEVDSVRPVVRGEWRQTGGKYSRHKTIDRRILTCSVCGNVLGMEAVNCGRGDANFCPNCGADMRGDDNGD